MNTDTEYNEMAHIADIVSYKKTDPKEAVKAQFAMWVAEKLAALEARVAELEGANTSTEEPAPDAGEETTDPEVQA